MSASRRLSETEIALEYFYSRTYRVQYGLRIGTIGLVGLVCVHFGLLPIVAAAIWVVAFLTCELLIWIWWRGVEPTLGTLDPAAASRRQRQMICFAGLSTSTAVAPFLVSVAPSPAAAAVSALFAAGVIMLITAQQSMTRNMFLWTVPLPALALVRNMVLLGDGASPFIMGGLAVCFIVNARQLQLSNAAGEARMVHNQVEAQRANDAKREFLATVSHEIRTPLNGVLGMAQAMAADDLSPIQAERLQIVRRSGAALQTLLNDVLDLSKIEAGRLELDIRPFNLADTIVAAVEPFLALARGKGLDLRIDVDGLDGPFDGDPNRVRQIVANLVSNAVKFTDSGSIQVEGRLSADGAIIQVRDTGIGISSDAASRMFDRFAQAEAGTAGRYGGTGLGLSICRDLASLMNGTIDLVSTPGQGSTFTLSLPLAAASRPLPGPQGAASYPVALGALRVLVAEDNPTNQLVLRHLLAAFGEIRVTIVDDGAAALAAFDREPWDLVLMDINMPILDGVAATREIRRREADTGRTRTPILALTANAMAHQVEDYLAAGLDEVVAKPVDAGALLAAMGRVLSDAADADRQVA